MQHQKKEVFQQMNIIICIIFVTVLPSKTIAALVQNENQHNSANIDYFNAGVRTFRLKILHDHTNYTKLHRKIREDLPGLFVWNGKRFDHSPENGFFAKEDKNDHLEFKRPGVLFNLCEIPNLPNNVDGTMFTASCLTKDMTNRVIVDLHIDIDNCDPNPCVNGGVCTDGINSYTCTCEEGYTGENCVAVNGGWSSWGGWGTCNRSCGTGNKTKTRTCTNPAPAHGGNQCQGDSSYSEKCKTKECPVNGGWSSWGAYGSCNRSCGTGHQTKTRTCTNPAPAHGGNQCQGDPSYSEKCKTKECPVNGGWSSWGAYGSCNRSCGTGRQTKTRTCTNPAPAHGGNQCQGDSSYSEECKTKECPVNGGWSSWGAYGSCNRSCGTGHQTKTRTYTNPAPAHGGNQCPGDSSYSEKCKTKECPVNGGWSSWGAYGSCNRSCGTGHQTKTRTCTNPAPAHGGNQCQGDSSYSEKCKTKECPVNGVWSLWDGWSGCSRSCGGGSQTKTRSCTDPAPSFGGRQCRGHSISSRNCNTQGCRQIDIDYCYTTEGSRCRYGADCKYSRHWYSLWIAGDYACYTDMKNNWDWCSSSCSFSSKTKYTSNITNTGKSCWGHCNSKQGACSWCGSEGMCCTQKTGWNDMSKGCDGTFGGLSRHECVRKPKLSVRLIGGKNENEGRVEVKYGGYWGTVCDDSWDIYDAKVVCKMLGYNSALSATQGKYFSKGSGPIILDDVQCIGHEENIADCKHNGYKKHNCQHTEDAGVICGDLGCTATSTNNDLLQCANGNFGTMWNGCIEQGSVRVRCPKNHFPCNDRASNGLEFGCWRNCSNHGGPKACESLPPDTFKEIWEFSSVTGIESSTKSELKGKLKCQMIINSKLKCYYISRMKKNKNKNWESIGVLTSTENPLTFTVTGKTIQLGKGWKGFYNTDDQIIWRTNNGMEQWNKISVN